MDQATFELDAAATRAEAPIASGAGRAAGCTSRSTKNDAAASPVGATARAEDVDRQGFDIGWDHAHHGLVPPAELLLDGTPVCQGWLSGKAVFGRRTLRSTRHTRQWLQLRMEAWRLGIPFEGQQLTPNYLGQIEAGRCPVTRLALHGLPGQADTAVVARLNPQAGYAAGNLALLSQTAQAAWHGLGVQDCVRQAHTAAAQVARVQEDTRSPLAAAEATSHPAAAARSAPAASPATPPLPAAVWWRLAALRSFATPLPFALAATLPMAVLPPNRVRLLNAVQGLQALLTRGFAAPGWAERCRRFAQWLPQHTLRQDFNLFVGAMAPRVLEAGQDPASLRLALEDAWLNERVLRRWTHLVLSLGEAGTEALLQRAMDAGLAGVRTLQHAPEQAVEGWALPTAALATAAASASALTRSPLRVAARLQAPRGFAETTSQTRSQTTALPAAQTAAPNVGHQALLC